jgi:hypothetical protein
MAAADAWAPKTRQRGNTPRTGSIRAPQSHTHKPPSPPAGDAGDAGDARAGHRGREPTVSDPHRHVMLSRLAVRCIPY